MSMNDLLIKERAENAQLRAQVAELEQRIAELENKNVTPINHSEMLQGLICEIKPNPPYEAITNIAYSSN